MARKLVSINDFTVDDVQEVFALAKEVKEDPSQFENFLKKRMIALIFEKPSTRTWVSFQTGVFALGGATVYLGPEDLKLGKREEIRDTARVLDRYLAGVVLRTFSHATIVEFQKHFRGAVINGLSDSEHPCQALADYFTIREKFAGRKKKPLVAYVGDGNNVLNSLLLLAAHLGERMHYATPQKHEPPKKVLDQVAKYSAKSGALIQGFHDAQKAVKDADVVYTDVWVSMGEESKRAEKLKEFKGMQVNAALMKLAAKNAYVMHCLPAHRGEEITDEVIEGSGSIVFDQAENRMHVQKAILIHMVKE